MEAITIIIYEASEGGYMYDIYEGEGVPPCEDAYDGGHCTSTLENAIEMAASQAVDLVKRS